MLARRTGQCGWQRLPAALDSSPLLGAGRVEDVRVLRSVRLLDDAVCQWRFTPTFLNGTPVRVRMTVTCRLH